jgi:hypothetical protein
MRTNSRIMSGYWGDENEDSDDQPYKDNGAQTDGEGCSTILYVIAFLILGVISMIGISAGGEHWEWIGTIGGIAIVILYLRDRT